MVWIVNLFWGPILDRVISKTPWCHVDDLVSGLSSEWNENTQPETQISLNPMAEYPVKRPLVKSPKTVVKSPKFASGRNASAPGHLPNLLGFSG